MSIKTIITAIALTIGAASNTIKAQDVPLDQFDKRGIEVLNKFMDALNANAADENAAAVAAIPYIHKSEYDNTGTALKKDRMDFSFKKAWQNAKFYEAPIKVTRVQKQNLTGIGFQATAQLGVAYKVWVGKKAGVAGLPAPLNIFFPADGTDPKVYYYGSL